MIFQKLINLIEDNADELTKRLMKDLLGREETRHYRNLSEDLVYERVFDVYSRLGSWLSREKNIKDIKEYYTQLGKKRYYEGIPLHEVIMALMLIKRHLWLYVLEKHFFNSTYECYQALEMNNKVVLFFDRIIFFTTIGYEDELEKKHSIAARGGVFSRIFKKH